MKHNKSKYIKNSLVPCTVFSLITGAFTGAVIFLFKLCSGYVIDTSAALYAYVRENPIWLPCLIFGAAVIGLIAALILSRNNNARGGGIPTSVAILRGLIDFHWVKNLFGLFISSLLTFFGGVPLGTEGPSVQMGTAIGRGTVRLFGKKQKAWDRYIMTGGACGGFAVATGAPLSGIIFAFEEAHRRFSPLLFMTVAMTVSASTATMHLLCSFTGVSPYLFDFVNIEALPLGYLWVAVVIGIVCGFAAIMFTHAYSKIGVLLDTTLKSIPFAVKTVAVFAIVSLLGFASKDFIGSGHELITELIEGEGIWYMLLICFCVRALSLMAANHTGVSGGIFVPSLAFGALIGALLSRAAVQMGILPQEYFTVPIIIGMSAFLAASSRTPIAAMAFALEALGGLSNSLPIAVGVMLAFLIIEIWNVPSLQDTVISQKVKLYNDGKRSVVVDSFVEVMPNSFAEGKEVRNILWPPTCTVLSIKKPHGVGTAHEAGLMQTGDILQLHYQTYDAETTKMAIAAIVGEQPEDKNTKKHAVDDGKQVVPDI